MPRYDGGGPALGHLSDSVRVFRIRNDLLPELKVLGPQVDGGPKAEVTLRERDKGREGSDGVSRKMMRLEAEFLEEVVHKVAGRKPKSALEMGYEDDILAFLEIRRSLGTRQPAFHPGWDPPRPDQPV